MRRKILFVVPVAILGFVFACTDSNPSGPIPSDVSLAKGGSQKVRSIAVTPSSASVPAGQTVQLTATPNPVGSATSFAWTSSNNAVATVSASGGLVTGVAAGTATISASAGGKTGSATITVTSTTPPPTGVVFVGAGDIASCTSTGDEATADLLDGIAGTVFNLGDNVYDNGTAAEYTNCYHPSWGRHKARTRPTPGNHEYNSGGGGYYGYFGAAAGDPTKGYYSYDLGDWHIIVLNSNSNCVAISCAAGSAQDTWLRTDLALNTKPCTLAYWHHPRFNSGASHGNNTNVGPFWNALYEYNADVILNGHEHVYERFAPQTPLAAADPVRGIRQFTVGTGGRSHYTFNAAQPNSQVRNGTTFGVLKLTLKTGGYDWQFVPVAGATFTDVGSGSCH